jgi:hypothetical protein
MRPDRYGEATGEVRRQLGQPDGAPGVADSTGSTVAEVRTGCPASTGSGITVSDGCERQIGEGGLERRGRPTVSSQPVTTPVSGSTTTRRLVVLASSAGSMPGRSAGHPSVDAAHGLARSRCSRRQARPG